MNELLIQKMDDVDVLSSGLKQDFWVLYLRPLLNEMIEHNKKALISCPQDKVAFLQGKTLALIEILERPLNDLKARLEKERT